MRIFFTNAPDLQIDTATEFAKADAQAGVEEIERLLGAWARSRYPQSSGGLKSRLLVSIFVSLSVGWFGYACAANVMVLASDEGAVDSTALNSEKTDPPSLPVAVVEPVAEVRASGQAIQTLEIGKGPVQSTALTDADLLEPLTFRGSIAETLRTLPVAAPAPVRKKRRSVTRINTAVAQVEAEQPEMPPPSLLEKLFGLRFPS